MSTVQIKILKDLPNHKADSKVTVKVDAKGIPLVKFWRDRLLDAKVDSCIEIVKTNKQPAKKESLQEIR